LLAYQTLDCLIVKKSILCLIYVCIKYTVSQKRPKFETVQREIITIDCEDILQKYSKVPEQSLHFACFRLVSCRFAFLLTFCLSNMTPKITRILTLYQANAPTLTPISKEDKILIKNLYECKGYNARQFITKFLNKDWTKNSIPQCRHFYDQYPRRQI